MERGLHKIKSTGAVLVGKSDINGREGILAELPDGKPLKIGGGETIINEKSSTVFCKELSDINVAGGGVAFDCGLQKVANTDRTSGKMPKDEYHQENAASGIRTAMYGGRIAPNVYFEISDTNYRWKYTSTGLYALYKSGKACQLGELISHPALFKEYPSASLIKVRFKNGDTNSGLTEFSRPIEKIKVILTLNFSYYEKHNKEFESLDGKNPEDSKEAILLHELQHILQAAHNRSSGTSYDKASHEADVERNNLRNRKKSGDHLTVQEQHDLDGYNAMSDDLLHDFFYYKNEGEKQARMAVRKWLRSKGIRYVDPLTQDFGIEFENDKTAASGINIHKNPTKDELRNVLSGKSQDSEGKAIRSVVAYIERNRRSGKISGRDGESKKEEQRVLIQYINENNFWIDVNLGEFTRGGEEQSVKLDIKYATKLSNAVYYDLWSDYFYNLLLHNFFFPDTEYELIGFYKLQHIVLAVVRQPFVRLTDVVNLEDIEKYLANKGFVKTDGNNYKNTELGISIKDLHERNVLMKDDIPYFIDTHFVIDDKSILPLQEMPASEGRKIHGLDKAQERSREYILLVIRIQKATTESELSEIESQMNADHATNKITDADKAWLAYQIKQKQQHLASGINIHKNPIKNEINNILSGKGEVSNGESIQAAISYLKRNAPSGTVAARTKREEEETLRKYKPLIFISERPHVGEGGTEHSVYRFDDKTLLKTNSGYFYKSWEDYLTNLLLHNYFFPDTAYTLIGFTEEEGKFRSVVKQRFVKATEPNDMDFVKEWLTNNGFKNTRNDDYFHSELGIIIEDLHDQNIITENGIIYFIDTVFFLKSTSTTSAEAGVKTNGMKKENSRTYSVQDRVIFTVDSEELDQLFNKKYADKAEYLTDRGDTFYALTQKDFDRFIDDAENENLNTDENVMEFFMNSKGVMVFIEKPDVNPAGEPDVDETWTDPAGGTHSANDDDPASDYAAGGKRIKADDLIGVDTLSKSKEGIYTARKSFFYTHGGSSEKFAQKIQEQLPNAIILDRGEVWKAFKGGASVAAQSHWWVTFKMKNEEAAPSSGEPLTQHIPLETIDVSGKSIREMRKILFDQPKYKDDQVIVVHGARGDYETTLRKERMLLYKEDNQEADAGIKSIDIINDVRAAGGTKTPTNFHRGDKVRVAKIITSIRPEKMGKAGVITNTIGRGLYAVKFADDTASTFTKEELEIIPNASSGTKTPTPMNLYYLKPGNKIQEHHNGAIAYTYEIRSFKKTPAITIPGSEMGTYGGNYVAMVKEHSITPGRPTPEFEIKLDDIMSHMENKHYTIEGCTFETDRDKILLQTEISGIINEEQGKELEAILQDTKLRAAQAEENLGSTKAEHEAHKAAADDTIAGMEAMASGTLAPEGVRQGGLTDAVFNTYSVQHYGNGFGWTGHELRTDALDKFTEKTFKKLGMSAREIGAFVTSRIGRKWGDALSFGKADATKEAPSIKKWFFDENGHNMDDYEQSMAGGGIANNYKMETGRSVWNKWTEEQRDHFLKDHRPELSSNDRKSFTYRTYEQLPEKTQIRVNEHISDGQYSGGGRFKKESDIIAKDIIDNLKEYKHIPNATIIRVAKTHKIKASPGIIEEVKEILEIEGKSVSSAAKGARVDQQGRDKMFDFMDSKATEWKHITQIEHADQAKIENYLSTVKEFDLPNNFLPDSKIPKEIIDSVGTDPFIGKIHGAYYYMDAQGYDYPKYIVKIFKPKPSAAKGMEMMKPVYGIAWSTNWDSKKRKWIVTEISSGKEVYENINENAANEWAKKNIKSGTYAAKGTKVGEPHYRLTKYSGNIAEETFSEGESTETYHSFDVPYNENFSSKKDLIKEMNKIMGTQYKESDFDWETGEGKNVQTDVLVAENQAGQFLAADKKEVSKWKNGKQKLYNAHYFFYIEQFYPVKGAFVRYSKGAKVGGGETNKEYWTRQVSQIQEELDTYIKDYGTGDETVRTLKADLAHAKRMAKAKWHDSASSGIQIKKLTKKKNFWHARLRVPRGVTTCRVPDWGKTVASHVHSGAKITMCKFGENWHIQKVMVPVKGVSQKQAHEIAVKIASKLHKK